MPALDAHDDRLRIGDVERESAYEALGAHLRAGRLDPHEYVDRMESCALARTAADLAPHFADLPWPSPFRLQPATVAAPPVAAGPARQFHAPAWVGRVGPFMLARLAAVLLVAAGLGAGAHIWWLFVPVLLVLLAARRCRAGRDPRDGYQRYDHLGHDRFGTQMRPFS